jgi:hypothetical protein
MSTFLKYTILIIGISTIAVIIGARLLIIAFRQRGKGREAKLAAGNILIAVFGAIGSAFVADAFRPVDVESLREGMGSLAVPGLASDIRCLNFWRFDGEAWHYSLTTVKDSTMWQVARPVFDRLSPTRLVGHGVWINDGSRWTYRLEVGCRGNRGMITFTLATVDWDAVPTIEVYPQLPDNDNYTEIVGYAFDRTWDEDEALSPVIVSRSPLYGAEQVGLVRSADINARLSRLWSEHARAIIPQCKVCSTYK